MVNAFSRSWKIVKLSWGVVKKDKEIIMYPIFNFFVSLAFLIGMLFPTIILAYINGQTSSDIWGWAQYLLVFLVYLGLAVINTFFNVCIVYTAKTRFQGGNATIGSSFKFAFKKLHLIFYWGILAATVGVLLNILRNSGGKSQVGNAVARGAARVGEIAWRIMTIFVVPVLVYEGLTPFKAIKKSVNVLKKTWGESIIRYFGLGLAKFIFILLGIVLTFGLGYLLLYVFQLANIGFYIILAFGIIYFTIILTIFAALKQIFNTALFEFAENGTIPHGFDKTTLESAFRPKGVKVSA